MARKKKRKQPKSKEVQPPAQLSAPKVLAQPVPTGKSSSNVLTYLLCLTMFAAGVMAEKAYDRWRMKELGVGRMKAPAAEQKKAEIGRHTPTEAKQGEASRKPL